MVALNRPQFSKLSCRLCEAESASLASYHHSATNSYFQLEPYETESACDSYCISSTDSQNIDNLESDTSFYEIPGAWTNESFSALIMRTTQNIDMNTYNSAISTLGQSSPDISEFYDTPLTQAMNTTNDYYNLQRWLIPDKHIRISNTNPPRIIPRKNSSAKLSMNRVTHGSPWVCYYPPTPPIHHNDPVYQTIIIPAPPTSPAPSPPGKNRKRVHFSGTDEIFIAQSELGSDVTETPKLVVSSAACRLVQLCSVVLFFCFILRQGSCLTFCVVNSLSIFVGLG